jgi:hypothetical protein
MIFLGATTYFINQKSSYNKQHMWKLKDKPTQNDYPEFADKI